MGALGRLLCRRGWHRFGGPGEMVRDESIARGWPGIVTEVGYFRYRCTRPGCFAVSDLTSPNR